MSQLTYTLADSATMLRRELKRLDRCPSMTVLLVGVPVVFLLLFVYVFGGQLGASLGAGHSVGHASRTAYLNFIVRASLTSFAVALGLAAKSVETASNTPMVLTLLPFLGSGFVTVASLPAGLRQFAGYQPFTP